MSQSPTGNNADVSGKHNPLLGLANEAFKNVAGRLERLTAQINESTQNLSQQVEAYPARIKELEEATTRYTKAAEEANRAALRNEKALSLVSLKAQKEAEWDARWKAFETRREAANAAHMAQVKALELEGSRMKSSFLQEEQDLRDLYDCEMELLVQGMSEAGKILFNQFEALKEQVADHKASQRAIPKPQEDFTKEEEAVARAKTKAAKSQATFQVAAQALKLPELPQGE